MTEYSDLSAVDKLKTRIQGLRAKTTDNCCTEAEALLAAAKVAELLDRYDLSLTDVEIRHAPCGRREYETHRKKRIPLDDCIGAIANFCDCRVWREKNQAGEARYVFFGLRQDIEVAHYLTELIDSAVRAAASSLPLSKLLDAYAGDYLRGIQGVVYGAVVIAIILAAPDGLYWTLRDRFFRPKVPAPIPAPPARAKAAVSNVSSATTLMSVEGLSKSFGGLRAVSNVSFTIGHGEILGIIGPNGAGKTTLFNVLNGVLPADEGIATLAGESMLGKKVHQVCRMGVGRTFQVVRSFPRLPLIDNVIVGAYGAGLSDQEAADEAIRALHRTGLAERAGIPAGQLTKDRKSTRLNSSH